MSDIPHWHVLGNQIREEDTLPASGPGLVHVHVVPYMIDSGPAKGQTGEVRVPDEDYVPATVESMINAKTSTTHAIGGLGHGNG